VFAISQAALRYALPRGVQVLTEPNKFGSLLDPGIYRDIEISDMYLVEDVLDDMLVPPLDVPAFQATPMNKVAFKTAYESLGSPTGKNIFKSERKSDFESGNYKATITKVRKAAKYPVAAAQFKQMMGTEGDEDEYEHGETMYILRCLDTDCSGSSLFGALDYYPSGLINSILHDDFNYRGNEVLPNKENLLLVCEAVGSMKLEHR